MLGCSFCNATFLSNDYRIHVPVRFTEFEIEVFIELLQQIENRPQRTSK
jgi:hypothetical protein